MSSVLNCLFGSTSIYWSSEEERQLHYTVVDLKSSTQALHPNVRSDLVQDVSSALAVYDNNKAASTISEEIDKDNNNNSRMSQQEIQDVQEQVEEELNSAYAQLEEAQDKEQFVKVRLDKYTILLQKIANDEEQMQKRIEMESNLAKVKGIHETMQKNIQQLETQILMLENKQAELEKMKEECREFLRAAAEAESQQERDVAAGDGGEENGTENIMHSHHSDLERGIEGKDDNQVAQQRVPLL